MQQMLNKTCEMHKVKSGKRHPVRDSVSILENISLRDPEMNVH